MSERRTFHQGLAAGYTLERYKLSIEAIAGASEHWSTSELLDLLSRQVWPEQTIILFWETIQRADAMRSPLIGMPNSARAQWYMTKSDLRLSRIAAVGNRQRTWWWGRRVTKERTGPWCYLCDGPIPTTTTWSPPNHDDRRYIMAHRAGHVAQLVEYEQVWPLAQDPPAGARRRHTTTGREQT